jgi:hypothetical protein
VAALPWNQWQLSRGMGGRLRLESVATLVWNTQKAKQQNYLASCEATDWIYEAGLGMRPETMKCATGNSEAVDEPSVSVITTETFSFVVMTIIGRGLEGWVFWKALGSNNPQLIPT